MFKNYGSMYILVTNSCPLSPHHFTVIKRHWRSVNPYIFMTKIWTFYQYCRNLPQVKVKQSHYRPWQALKFPGVWDSQILRQSVHEEGKVVSPMHRPPSPPGNISSTYFCYRLSRPQGHSAAGRIMTPSGIDPATFRYVAQCLNYCANAYLPQVPA
jgi:hypothetical protein